MSGLESKPLSPNTHHIEYKMKKHQCHGMKKEIIPCFKGKDHSSQSYTKIAFITINMHAKKNNDPAIFFLLYCGRMPYREEGNLSIIN